MAAKPAGTGASMAARTQMASKSMHPVINGAGRRQQGVREARKRRSSMFAARDSFSYTDEELAEYERQEGESAKTRRNRPRTNLGDPGNR